MELTLTNTAWQAICRHATETFPDECCGVILNDATSDIVRRCTNIQNRLHSLDPDSYPRTATTAYTMDIKEMEAVMGEVETRGAKIKAFYHSHPGHEPYFSQEDKAFASPFGEPTFPDAAQIVISIYDREVRRLCAYMWSADKKDFVEVSLRKISSP